MMDNKEFILSILVKNEPDALMRVSNLFLRKGYTITNLSVGTTETDLKSRITIQTFGDGNMKEQIKNQLEKLVVVESVECIDANSMLCRELMLVQMNIKEENQKNLQKLVSDYNGQIAHISSSSVIIEIAGETMKLNALLHTLMPFGITKVCRTGLTAILKGA
jgi:acetolactate synthase-1/3 small subunit